MAASPAYVSAGESRADGDRRLFVRYRELGDLRARDELCERFMPLARQLARRYDRGGGSSEDLMQVASLALVKAVDRFDVDRGMAFSSFAVPTILGELRRHFRDTSWAVHVPRGMQERIAKAEEATARLSRENGRSPSAVEIARDLDLTPELVIEALEFATARHAASLDSPSGLDPDGASLGDSLGADDESFSTIEYLDAIGPVMRALPQRERLILKLRFVDDLKQSEIAERVGVSQMHVSRLMRRSLDRLRTVADAY